MYALIGDLHSQADKLERALSYCDRINAIPLLLGDIFDSRCEYSDSEKTFYLLHEREDIVILRSNHQDKLERYLKGNNVTLNQGLEKTVSELQNIDSNLLLTWLESFPYVFSFEVDSKKYNCAHAYYHPSIIENEELAPWQKKMAIYGPRLEGNVRRQWWLESDEKNWCRVAGHYHTIYITDYSIVLDGHCGSGGFLPVFVPELNEFTRID